MPHFDFLHFSGKIHTMKQMPKTVPLDMQAVIERLRDTDSQEECLRQAYDILIQKYHGNRLKTLLRFFELFSSSVNTLWYKNGFMHCTNLNRLLYILLVKSGHFTKNDIETRWTLLWYISPHQYIQVSMKNGQRINVDVWAHVYGISFGDYAHGFHAYRKNSK